MFFNSPFYILVAKLEPVEPTVTEASASTTAVVEVSEQGDYDVGDGSPRRGRSKKSDLLVVVSLFSPILFISLLN